MKQIATFFALFLLANTATAEIKTRGLKINYSSENYSLCSLSGLERDIANCNQIRSQIARKDLRAIELEIETLLNKEQNQGKIQAFKNMNEEWEIFIAKSCQFDAADASGYASSSYYNDCITEYVDARILLLSKYKHFITNDYSRPSHLYMVVSPQDYGQ